MFDTYSCIVGYPVGFQAIIDDYHQSSYGYDQRAEGLGTNKMVAADNMYPNTAKTNKEPCTENTNIPHLFFLSRYTNDFVTETVTFCEYV